MSRLRRAQLSRVEDGRAGGSDSRRLGSIHEVPTVSSARASSSQEAVRRFVDGMAPQERMLVVLKRELYEGRWDEMVADLQARLEGRPYIFKLAHRISDDLERITRLRRFEQEHGVDLGEYVESPT